jgi:acetolactate synthase-1/2/3 large subunit
VFVVDDDPLQLRALERGVRGNKRIELATSDNAIDAMLRLGGILPDAVVLDVFMPGLDGIEACRRIKANPATAHVDVILASAQLSPQVEADARRAGATRVLAKPIDVAALFDRGEVEPVAVRSAPEAAVVTPTPTMRGADLIVQMLADAGVDVVFGLPGGAISSVHDALLDSPIRVVTTRHENGAMFAAAGYAQTTGKLGVVAVTSGPGALNAMTGLASAWCDGLPVLLLVGEVPRASHGLGVLQDGSSHGLQLVEMARHISKLALEVPRTSALPHLLRRAIATALSGRKGPVVLTLPLDVANARIAPPQSHGAVTVGEVVTGDTLDEVARLMVGAARPLLLAGSGVRGNGAPARLRAVAERLECPVATTPKAKGVFPEDHPLSLGVLGLGGHRSARSYLDAGTDVVLAIGTSLGDMSTDGFAPQLQASRALVHVDIDARQIGKSYSPTHAIVASAASLLGGLAERLGEAPTPRRRLARGTIGLERQVLQASQKHDRIAMHDAVVDIQSMLPADTIYTIDSGEHFVAATHHLRIIHPDAFIAMTGLGSMGQSIGAAIGAALAKPGRSVAAICGDGCFAMNAFEIATAVAERIPIRVFVFNDERLGMVEHGHKTVYGRRPSYPTAPLDVCSVARGLGAETLRAGSRGELRDAVTQLREVAGPVVIDVRIDHEILLERGDRVARIVTGDVHAPPKLVVN